MEEDITVGGDAAGGTMDEPHEISLPVSSKSTGLRSKSIVSACEGTPSWWPWKFSAHRLLKPFAVIFKVTVMLIVFIVLITALNGL